jgi:hypothetical protein
MRYIDFIIQTLLILSGVVILIFTYDDSNWPSQILYVQLIPGLWQVLGSIISVIHGRHLHKEKRLHLNLCPCYLLGLYIVFNSTLLLFSEAVIQTLLIIPAWMLVFYNYFITVRHTFPRRGKAKAFSLTLDFNLLHHGNFHLRKRMHLPISFGPTLNASLENELTCSGKIKKDYLFLFTKL